MASIKETGSDLIKAFVMSRRIAIDYILIFDLDPLRFLQILYIILITVF